MGNIEQELVKYYRPPYKAGDWKQQLDEEKEQIMLLNLLERCDNRTQVRCNNCKEMMNVVAEGVLTTELHIVCVDCADIDFDQDELVSPNFSLNSIERKV